MKAKQTKPTNTTHKGPGFCERRHVWEKDDFCNQPVVAGTKYCSACKCSEPGCPNKWSCMWPLMGHVGLCREHQTSTIMSKYGVEHSNHGYDHW